MTNQSPNWPWQNPTGNNAVPPNQPGPSQPFGAPAQPPSQPGYGGQQWPPGLPPPAKKSKKPLIITLIVLLLVLVLLAGGLLIYTKKLVGGSEPAQSAAPSATSATPAKPSASPTATPSQSPSVMGSLDPAHGHYPQPPGQPVIGPADAWLVPEYANGFDVLIVDGELVGMSADRTIAVLQDLNSTQLRGVNIYTGKVVWQKDAYYCNNQGMNTNEGFMFCDMPSGGKQVTKRIDLATGGMTEIFTAPDNGQWTSQLGSYNQNYLVVAYTDSTATLQAVDASQKQIWKHDFKIEEGWGCKLIDDSVACQGSDNAIMVFDAATGRVKVPRTSPPDASAGAVWLTDGYYFASESWVAEGRKQTTYDFNGKECLKDVQLGYPEHPNYQDQVLWSTVAAYGAQHASVINAQGGVVVYRDDSGFHNPTTKTNLKDKQITDILAVDALGKIMVAEKQGVAAAQLIDPDGNILGSFDDNSYEVMFIDSIAAKLQDGKSKIYVPRR